MEKRIEDLKNCTKILECDTERLITYALEGVGFKEFSLSYAA